MNVDPIEYRRLTEATFQLAELRTLWRQMQDYGSTFTSPRQRLDAAERFRSMLDG